MGILLFEREYYAGLNTGIPYTIKIWNSEKIRGKYSFSIGYGNGVMSKCPEYPQDSKYSFGQFNAPDEALQAAKQIIDSDRD